MREIKFRAWDKLNKIMIFHITDIDFEDNTIGYNHCFQAKFPEQIELMQFTGLKDSKNREIWEGDIVSYYYNPIEQWKPKISEVKYGPPNFYLASQEWNDQFVKKEYLEVIGNIYENKNLLKERSLK